MFEQVTPEVIKRRIFGGLADSGVEIDVREGSYTDALVAPAALELWKLYASMNALLSIVYPDETSGEYIDKKCACYGIERKAGTAARAVLTATGKDGAVLPKGAVFLTAEGLRFSADAAAVVASGTAHVPVTAEEVGARGNVGAGEIFRQSASIPGITAVQNKTAAAGGAEPETDVALLERLYARLRMPATSGNTSHYKQWALEVAGVGAVKVMPLAHGPGTVTVLIAGADSGPVDREIVAACAAHIEAARPIGAAVTVATVVGKPINVAAAVTVDASVTKDAVRAAFSKALAEYLRGISFAQYTVPYTRIGWLLAGIDGVVDYSGLTVNGGAANVALAADEVPQAGTVVLT